MTKRNTYTCLRCGKSWRTHWVKNRNKLPKACKYCKSIKWNIQRIAPDKALYRFLMKLEGLNDLNETKEKQWQKKKTHGWFI